MKCTKSGYTRCVCVRVCAWVRICRWKDKMESYKYTHTHTHTYTHIDALTRQHTPRQHNTTQPSPKGSLCHGKEQQVCVSEEEVCVSEQEVCETVGGLGSNQSIKSNHCQHGGQSCSKRPKRSRSSSPKKKSRSRSPSPNTSPAAARALAPTSSTSTSAQHQP